jgi:hypothetical protein
MSKQQYKLIKGSDYQERTHAASWEGLVIAGDHRAKQLGAWLTSLHEDLAADPSSRITDTIDNIVVGHPFESHKSTYVVAANIKEPSATGPRNWAHIIVRFNIDEKIKIIYLHGFVLQKFNYLKHNH